MAGERVAEGRVDTRGRAFFSHRSVLVANAAAPCPGTARIMALPIIMVNATLPDFEVCKALSCWHIDKHVQRGKEKNRICHHV